MVRTKREQAQRQRECLFQFLSREQFLWQRVENPKMEGEKSGGDDDGERREESPISTPIILQNGEQGTSEKVEDGMVVEVWSGQSVEVNKRQKDNRS